MCIFVFELNMADFGKQGPINGFRAYIGFKTIRLLRVKISEIWFMKKKRLKKSLNRHKTNLIRGLIGCTAMKSSCACSVHTCISVLYTLNSWQAIQILQLRPVRHSSVCDWSVLMMQSCTMWLEHRWETLFTCLSCLATLPSTLLLVRPVIAIQTHVILDRHEISSLAHPCSRFCVQGGFSPSVSKSECPARINRSIRYQKSVRCF